MERFKVSISTTTGLNLTQKNVDAGHALDAVNKVVAAVMVPIDAVKSLQVSSQTKAGAGPFDFAKGGPPYYIDEGVE